MNSASSKWIYIGLFISLALNIFIIGYFFGNFPNKSKLDSLSTIPMTQEMKDLTKYLPAEDRKQMNALIIKQQKEIIANQEAIRQVRIKIGQLLQQEPLDKQQLGVLFEKLYELSSVNIGLAQQTIYQTLIQLPLAERIKVGKVLATAKPKATIPNKPT